MDVRAIAQSRWLWNTVAIAAGVLCFVLAFQSYLADAYKCASVKAGPVCGIYLIVSELFGPRIGVMAATLSTCATGVFLLWLGITGMFSHRER